MICERKIIVRDMIPSAPRMAESIPSMSLERMSAEKARGKAFIAAPL